MSQMGRPKLDNPKFITIKARIDEETNKKIMNYCQSTGKTRTEVVREGILLILGQNNKTLPTDQS